MSIDKKDSTLSRCQFFQTCVIDLIQFNKNPNMIFCGYLQTDSQVLRETKDPEWPL